jgi:MSHA biogenesis protein MshQ
MAIAFGAAGAVANTATTTLTLAYPTGITAGQLIVMCICNKYPPNTPTTPAGFTLAANAQGTGGSGAAGIDTGTVYMTVYYRIAPSALSGNVSITVTGNNVAIGRIFRYTNATNNWDVSAANGADNTAGSTAWLTTMNVNPGLTAGDWVIVASGINTDLYTFSAQAPAEASTTFGATVERQDSGTTSGQDCALVVTDTPVTAGTSTVAPTYSMTSSGSAANNPAGSSVMLRIREGAFTGGSDQYGMMGFYGI